MLVVVSPAKKLNMQPDNGVVATEPAFSRNADDLVAVAQTLSCADLQSLMGVSETLAQLNVDRFAAFGTQDKKPAALAFAGDTYQGLDAATLTPEQWYLKTPGTSAIKQYSPVSPIFTAPM